MTGSAVTRGLVDTNLLILRHSIDLTLLPDEIAISAVTLAEISAGPLYVRGDGPEERDERARRILNLQWTESHFDPLPFDAEAARVYGQLIGGVLAAGRVPRRRQADLQIAATAVVNGLPLWTTNPDDFVGLERWVDVVPVPRPPTASTSTGAW